MTMTTKPDPASLPCGILDETAGLKYFPRMVGKIRLMEQGLLWDELHDNLGKGADGWLTGFLHLDYEALRARVLEGGSDEEILAWCEANGRPLNDSDRLVWNAFISKLGWNDHISATLEKRKAEGGLADRDDIRTIPDYVDVDEGRRE
jgi:gluconokinase